MTKNAFGISHNHPLNQALQVSVGAFADILERLRHGLRQIRYRSRLIDGWLTGTGLALTTLRLRPQYRASLR
ncbi:hypothetical protein [Streptomyces sp. NPDC058861]|uniref:hypothetical protein n=1 Tax=Streptomyces sp. NPDC058861 TaxID=3346653 RepID=UPI0036902525